MENCIFCKIASKQVPAEIVYEDEHFLAFLDINPKARQHTLLIPKAHHRWFHELPDELYDEMFRIVKKLVPLLKERAEADYVKLGIVGTDVPHVHVHLLPRKLAEKDNVI